MPSVPVQFLMGPFVPSLASFHGGLSSHRLKYLEKSDRRGSLSGNQRSRAIGIFLSLALDRQRLKKFAAVWQILNTPSEFVIPLKNLILSMDTQSCDVNVLGDALDKSLNIQEAQETDSASDGHEEAEDIYKQVKTWQATSSEKCLNKSVTFPFPKMMLPATSSSEEEDEERETGLQEHTSVDSKDQAHSRSISLPTPLELVSAMKGSREKRGILQETLTVKWAPDVYDPPPTLISHTVKSKRLQKYKNKKNEKRNGRKGQRGYSSQGGSGKDKKHIHKSTKISGKFGNYEVGSSNSYCGSSYRHKSRTEMHYSIAEAS